jgi:hypothetical protein
MSRAFEGMARRLGRPARFFDRPAPGSGRVSILEPIPTLKTAVVTTPAAVPASRVSVRTSAAEDAVRLALRLRECPAPSTGRLLLFAPVTRGVTVDRLVYETALALVHLGDGPVIVVDVNLSTPDHAPWCELPAVSSCNEAPPPPVSVFRPKVGDLQAVPYLASDDCSRSLEALKARCAFAICVGRALPESVDTLLLARRCDAVIMSVTPGRTTITEVQRVVADLRPGNASVFGFVMDASDRRPPTRR